MCGTDNAVGVQFCAACGSPMTEEAAKPKSEKPAGGVPAKTIMFGQSPQAAAPEKAADDQHKQETAKTVLGMPAVGGASQQPPMATPQQAPMAKPQQAPMAKPQQAPMATPKPAEQPAPAAAPGADRAHTVLGMPAVDPAAAAQEFREKAAEAAQPAPMVKTQQVPAAQPASEAKVLDDKRTVLGMPAAGDDAATVAAKAAVASKAAVAPKPRPSTEPLTPVPKVRDDIPPPPEPDTAEAIAADSVPDAEPASHADTWPDDDEEPLPPRKGGSTLLIVAIIAAVVVLAGGAAIVYLLMFSGDTEIRPQVFPAADGTNLTVVLSFPDAPTAGATITVHGEQQIQVVGGQARFDLPISQMALGENPIKVVYTEPGGGPETLTFPIVMRHTTTDDLSGLVAEDPFFMVVFRVAPGIQLAVDGKPVQLAGGAHSHRVSLSQALAGGPPSGDNLIHKVSFQLTDAGGQTEQGQHVVTLPVTKVQIDRPAKDATVALEAVTCSGSTEEGAQVTINGQPVGVLAKRFSTSVPLSQVGDHQIEIIARAPGKAPGKRTVKVTRLESLDGAIAEWSKDLDSKLDYPTLARDANGQMGKKIKISGRVVNINTEKGITAFLLYVGEGCPAGARCAVYVVFLGETDAGLQSLVDVYATVRGTKDVDLRGGEKETMPAVEARFVVKQKSKKSKRRGKR
jgi:hypothetical protein